MALSQLKKALIHLLKEEGATEDEAVGIMLLLGTTSKRRDMLDWMMKTPTATMEQICQHAVEIHDKA